LTDGRHRLTLFFLALGFLSPGEPVALEILVQLLKKLLVGLFQTIQGVLLPLLLPAGQPVAVRSVFAAGAFAQDPSPAHRLLQPAPQAHPRRGLKIGGPVLQDLPARQLVLGILQNQAQGVPVLVEVLVQEIANDEGWQRLSSGGTGTSGRGEEDDDSSGGKGGGSWLMRRMAPFISCIPCVSFVPCVSREKMRFQ